MSKKGVKQTFYSPADDLVGEEWLPAVGYESCYVVSNLGRVRSVDRIDAKGARRRSVILSPGHKLGGYPYVNLCDKARGIINHVVCVHTLVLEAFVGPRPDGTEGCHWDGNPENNRLDNLRWDTPQENREDAIRHGTIPVPTLRRTDWVDAVSRLVSEGVTVVDAATKAGVPINAAKTIGRACGASSRTIGKTREILALFDTKYRDNWTGVYAIVEELGVNPGTVSRVLNRYRREEYEAVKISQRASKQPPALCVRNGTYQRTEAINAK